MSKNMRGAGLTEGDAPLPSKDALAKVNAPHAREHAPHISGTNTIKNYTTPKPSLGPLGAKGQAGK